MSKKVTLWFLTGPASQAQKAFAREHSLFIRDPQAYRIGDSIEQADAVTGHPPAAYKERYELIDLPAGDEGGDGDKKLGIADIREKLKELGVEFDPAARKADLQLLLDQAEGQ